MKISVGADHLDLAKQQAYSIRDSLINQSTFSSLKKIHSKSSFLNTWAECLGYHDWGEFKAISKNANINSLRNFIITPESIGKLASDLIKKSYIHDLEQPVFEAILYQSTFEHEKALFSQDAIDYFNYWSVEIGTESHPITLELGPEVYQKHLVEMMFNHQMELRVEDAEKELLAYAKRKRVDSGLTKKTDIQNCSLDIYPKSGQLPNTIINKCIEDGWVEIFTSYDCNEVTEFYRLAERAINWFYMSDTMDFCDEWLEWNRSVDQLFKQSDLERMEEGKHSRLFGFRDEQSPRDYVNEFVFQTNSTSKITEYQRERAKKWKELFSKLIPNYSPGKDYLFHVFPKLFLTFNESDTIKLSDLNLVVELQVFGEENELLGDKQLFTDWRLLKPYPNKRYVSAQFRKEHLGEYILLPKGAKSVSCKYIWHDTNRNINVTHRVTIELQFIKGNHFFSVDHSAVYPFGRTMAKDFPSSFFDLNAVRSAATNIDELKQVSRFANQIQSFEKKDGEIKIDESIVVPSGALANYHCIYSMRTH